MKKRVILCLMLLISIVSVFANNNFNSYNEKVDGDVVNKLNSGEREVGVIVAFEERVTRAEKEGVLNSVDDKNESVEFSSGGFATEVTKEELNKLVLNDNVKYVEPIRYFDILLSESVNVTNANSTWPLQITGINLTGINQTVCVIDTGVNYSHRDLIGKNKTACNLDCIDKVCVEDCSVTDLNGHGTHVAGIVAANGNLRGIARGVDFIGLKVFPGSSASGATTTGVKNAIDWCVDNSAIYNISVITMSLGTSNAYESSCDADFVSFNTSITNAFNKNISVVIASGNEANTTAISSPACISKAIPVADTYNKDIIGDVNWTGTCTDSNPVVDQIVCHANRNSLVELLAPGALINSTWYDGGYYVTGGTSMAAPMVAGAIAIINQMLRLTSQTKNPLEIEDILNDSGKVIFDSMSRINYSRINVFSAILSIDNIAPNVSLEFPSNNHVNLTQNQTFTCNSSDWQISNVTFYLWNSSNSLVYNETKNISGVLNKTIFNRTNLNYDLYKWTCRSFDMKNNNFMAQNFSFTIGGLTISLLSPINYANTNRGYTNFTCNSNSEQTHGLSNVTFYLWNSSNSLVYNETKNVSGFSNSTLFNFTFSQQLEYRWNCLGYNNNSNFSFSSSNYSLVYDITGPVVNLSSVTDGTATTIDFNFNVSDLNLISNCSVYVDGTGTINSSFVNKSQTNTITTSGLSVGSHSAYVNCSDLAGNFGNSSVISFNINSPPIQSQSGGGGGGGGPTYKTYVVSENITSSGYTKELTKDDRISFEIFDEKAEKHTLSVDSVGSNFVNLTIRSNATNILLGIGQSIKLNLTSPDYYNLYIKLNRIVDKKAELTIQTIHDAIITKEEFRKGDNATFDAKDESNKEIGDSVLNGSSFSTAVTYILIVTVIVLIVWFLHSLKGKINNKRKNIKTAVL